MAPACCGGSLRFEGGYIVPRGDGRYVLGATVEERGFEQRPTAGGVYELLRDAHELVPGVRELQIEELSVGFRPSTPDNVPVIGRGALDGLLWATGHHRNGILLAPLTAELVDRCAGGGCGVILINGQRSELRAGATVAAVLAGLGLALDAPGVAVAVDGEVVPRSSWASRALGEDARVEVLTAMQGG